MSFVVMTYEIISRVYALIFFVDVHFYPADFRNSLYIFVLVLMSYDLQYFVKKSRVLLFLRNVHYLEKTGLR